MTYFKLIGSVLVILAVIALGPFAFIWALNTLFNLGIGFTFWTWLAVVVFMMFIGAGKISTK